jgi:hypothetical protein
MMWPNFLTLRNAAEQLRRLTRLVDEAPQAERHPFIRLPPGLVRPGNEKRSKVERDPEALDVIVGHVTDVRGGFGVQKWGPDGWKTWRDRLHSGDIPSMPGEAQSLLTDIRHAFGKQSDDDLARTLALCSRYAQTPYHYIASRKLGPVQNRPLKHRTYAANGGNVGASVAIDCHHREAISRELARIGQDTFSALHEDMSAERIRYTVHGQWSRQRWNDTHREVHLAVFKPVIERIADELGFDLCIDYEHSADGGRPLTTRDDPDAHFDTKGRRVRTPEGEPL